MNGVTIRVKLEKDKANFEFTTTGLTKPDARRNANLIAKRDFSGYKIVSMQFVGGSDGR